jgi:hypothetical protein
VKSYLPYIVTFATAFALAQLTRNVDYEHAIGFAVTAFWEAMGAGLTLFAMVLGGLSLFNVLVDKADGIADLIVSRRG